MGALAHLRLTLSGSLPHYIHATASFPSTYFAGRLAAAGGARSEPFALGGDRTRGVVVSNGECYHWATKSFKIWLGIYVYIPLHIRVLRISVALHCWRLKDARLGLLGLISVVARGSDRCEQVDVLLPVWVL